MAVSRQVRRAREREAAKRNKRGLPHTEQPNYQHGFSCDLVDETVVFTFYCGEVAITFKYSDTDAAHMGKMIVDCAQGKSEPSPEIVSGSGLVIANQMPPGAKV